MWRYFDKFHELDDTILRLKRQYNLEIYDTHIHPMDVMGIFHNSDYNFANADAVNLISKVWKEPGILERLKYGRVANLLSQPYCNFFAESVKRNIEKKYQNIICTRVIKELDDSLVDKAVLLPIEPWCSTGDVYSHFLHQRFKLLGSVDLHTVELQQIKSMVDKLIHDYSIIGIKLHPNLQNFYPQPSYNAQDVADKLRELYSIAEERRLYLLFHGGISFTPNVVNEKFVNISRSRNKGLLQNFYDSKNQKSELFDEYDVPIVIAHLGHYGALRFNKKLVKAIVDRYSHVYFDTAGVSPGFIRTGIEVAGSGRIIFGSDALYNRVKYNLFFLYLAIKQARCRGYFEEHFIDILQRNFLTLLSKR